MSRSQNIYDDPTFFDGYRQLRDNPYSLNILEEKPALFSLCPPLDGKTVLDLGCGYGENCAEFRSRGAADVTGVDISEKMLNIARAEHPAITFIRGDISDLSFLNDTYDVIFSSLAVHYVEDFNTLAKEIFARLNPNGCFIFSQEHPMTTALISGERWTRDADGNVLHYNLKDYTRSGKRTETWIVDGVIKYHRTMSQIVNALCAAGFVIEAMLEPAPTAEAIAVRPSCEKHIHKPNFLLLKARKTQ